MKNFKLLFLAFVFILVLPLAVSAQSEKQKSPKSETGSEQGQNGQAVQTNNQGQTDTVQTRVNLQNGTRKSTTSPKTPSERGLERRSMVANAVQELLRVADRNGGIGKQVSEIAKEQRQEQEAINNDVDAIQGKSKIRKFFFGPDNDKIDQVENKIKLQDEKLAKLKDLQMQIQGTSDFNVLAEQIKIMEDVKVELLQELDIERKTFSLFGWFGKIFRK